MTAVTEHARAIDLEVLEHWARLATPGPWRVSVDGNLSNLIEGPAGRPAYDGHDGYQPLGTYQACLPRGALYQEERGNARANGEHIAGAHPQTVLALVAAVKAALRVVGNPARTPYTPPTGALVNKEHAGPMNDLAEALQPFTVTK